MATLPTAKAPGQRIEFGDALLDAARAVDTRLVKERLAAFERIHKAYRSATTKVEQAWQRLHRQQQQVAEADVAQDESAEKLASALAGDGLPRTNPFKKLGFDAPSKLIKLGYEKEARQLLKLVKKVTAGSEQFSKMSQSAARAVEKAAQTVLKAITPVSTLEKTYRAALVQRDALAQQWETAFAAVKRGVKAAEDEGAAGLFASLFESTAARLGIQRAARPKASTAPAAVDPVEELADA